MKNFALKRLAVAAMMTALEVVLSRFLSVTTPLIKIGFGFLPVALTAMLYGPVWAGMVGGLADILGAVTFPVGPYFYGFTLSAIANGVIFGLFLSGGRPKLKNTVFAVLVSSAVVTLGLDTLWFSILTGNALPAVAVARLIKCAVMAPLQIICVTVFAKYCGEFIYKNSSTAQKKAQLRAAAKEYFNGEFLSERQSISRRITAKALALEEFKSAKTVFCYVGRENEIDTRGIISAALSSGKTVAVPLCEADVTMTARRITDLEQLKEGHFGIPEPPKDAETIEIEFIDLAVIPSLVCDSKGRRIGFGKGYYDRYFAKRGNITKVVLCPEKMIKKRVKKTAFDIKGDIVLS